MVANPHPLIPPTEERGNMSNTRTHAERELDILATTSPTAVINEFRSEILALCEAFGKSGQSGGSAPYTARALSRAVEKLCLHGTIAPLTGEDDEWNDSERVLSENGGYYQNNRESAVFKQRMGRAYYLNAIIWDGEDKGDSFTGTVEGIRSRQYIKSFPFKPKTFRVNVYRVPYDKDKHAKSDVVSCGSGDFVYFIKDKKQLDEVFAYYEEYKP